MGRINPTPQVREVEKKAFTYKNPRSAEFFIVSDLYSEAFVVLLA